MVKKHGRVPLSKTHPELLTQWHPTKNGELTPEQVVAGSGKKVWWVCTNGPDHEWLGTLANRSRGAGCPFCAGRYVSVTNSLATLSPQIASEWHPTNNGVLNPDQVVAGSNQKAWWKCPQGPDHEWQAVVDVRTRTGSGCPMCFGRAVSVTNSLSALYPQVAREWHPTKNGDLTPDMVASGAHQKAWWKCFNGPDHEWQAQIGSRTSAGNGCSFCAGKSVSVTNSLKSNSPELSAEWHPTRNGSLTPNRIIVGSNNKVWWECPKGPDHEWQSAVSDRTSGGNGCPFCSGYRASVTNSLRTLHPKLASQWHLTKNGNLTPEQFASGSRTRVWWKCQEGSDHEWQGVIGSRAQSRGETGCPFCSGYKLSVTNSLATVSPDIASQWHPTKNGDLCSDMVVAGSTRKVWWKCTEGPDHEWETKLVGRTHVGNGCPFCRGLKVSVTNSLEGLYPELAAQWHPIKNGSLTPDQVSFGSDKQAWWVCTEGPDHEWRAKVQERTRGQGCSFCAGKRVSVTNALTSLFPDVATQWHSTKNGDITPDKVAGASGKKVWWQCPNDPHHEWQASVANRTYSESGCPYCNLRPRSIQEIDLIFELKEFFDIGLEDRKLVEDGQVLDCDIIIRQERLIVEFDGSYWHSGDRMYNRDLAKTETLQKAGWNVIRVREEPLKIISSTDISVPLRQEMKLTVNAVLLKIQEILGVRLARIDDYLNAPHLQVSAASKAFARDLMRRNSAY